MINLLASLIAIPLVMAVIIFMVGRINRFLPGILAALTSLLLFGFVISLYLSHPANYLWRTSSLFIDGFSLLMLLIITFISLVISIYSIKYLDKYTAKENFHALYLLLVAGMIGVVIAGHLFLLFIFLELASISTYALVAFGTREEELEASMRYIILGTIASLFILLALALTYLIVGSLSIPLVALNASLFYTPKSFLLIILFLAGFGLKAAAVPFHAWLPDAHTSAPAPVSATLSGVLIKTIGVYCLIRILFNLLGTPPIISTILLAIGALSILVGGFAALGQWDIKRMLAYSSISQIGYILLSFGLLTPLGMFGAIFHLLNHAIFKPLLFLSAGSLELATGTRDMRKMGGLAKKMPLTWLAATLGSFSLAGIPPFNGFWSKAFIIFACVQSGKIGYALIAVIGAVLSLAYVLKMQKYVFFDALPSSLEKVKENPWLITLPILILGLICLFTGMFHAQLAALIVKPAVAAVNLGTALWQFFPEGTR